MRKVAGQALTSTTDRLVLLSAAPRSKHPDGADGTPDACSPRRYPSRDEGRHGPSVSACRRGLPARELRSDEADPPKEEKCTSPRNSNGLGPSVS